MTCREYRPDHNGECLNCDEPAEAHSLTDEDVDRFLAECGPPDPERVARIRTLFEAKRNIMADESADYDADGLATRRLYEQLGDVELMTMRRAFEQDRRRAVEFGANSITRAARIRRSTIEFCDGRIALIDSILSSRK